MHHTRVLRPAEGVYAFYDGRIEGYRFAEEGTGSTGARSRSESRAMRRFRRATHWSTTRTPRWSTPRFVRGHLEEEGVSGFTVVLSHWHLDHVAGTEVFRDCEVISSERTAEHARPPQVAIERGELEGPPAIDPLILPTRTYSDRLELTVGDMDGGADPHEHPQRRRDDRLAPRRRLLLCGDTMEDTVTYVDEPESFDVHLADLEKLREIAPDRILPNHGDPQT